MGRISKLGPSAACISLLIIAFSSFGCSKGSSSAPPPTVKVTISPSPTASVNLGSTLQFSATVTENTTAISTPVTFFSSNNRVLSFGPGGLACAGSWDASFIVCSPGAPGVVRVIASGFGTPSAATTVYVHPQVTGVEAFALSPPASGCVSQNQTENFQATVMSNGSDITPFVGPVTWSVVDSTVGKSSTTAAGLQPNQVQITAGQPGLTHIVASNSGVNSNAQATPFETCPVQSISIATATGANSLQLQTGASGSLVATVVDTQGALISPSSLTWASSQPGVVSTTVGSVKAVSPGGAAAFAVCTPPTCNVNLDPVYPANVVDVTVSGTAVANTVYVTSTGCFGTAAGCQVSLIPINTQTNAPGTAINVPSPPNSFVVDPAGTNAYMETLPGLRSMNLSSNAFLTFTNIKGRVLAISPDSDQVVVSDATDNPNVVSILGVKATSVTQLLISGVTAAAFSPDNSTAYLLAGNKLYLYSTTHPLTSLPLPGAASGAAFLTTGAFGFVAGAPSTVSLFNGCNSAAPVSPNTATVSTISQPALLAALPDGKTIIAVNSPGFTSIAVNTSAAGCPPPVSASATFHDFGQGGFTPTQLLVSSDGTRLYVISNLDRVLVYDFPAAQAKIIPLTPSTTPLSAALTLSGHDLYVGASDGTVHHLDTVNLVDRGQIAVSPCSNSSISCPPNLVELRP